jgi:hypothetical protein
MDEDNIDNKKPQLKKGSMSFNEALITGSLLELAGYVIIFSVSWKLGVGFFLYQWGKQVIRSLGYP